MRHILIFILAIMIVFNIVTAINPLPPRESGATPETAAPDSTVTYRRSEKGDARVDVYEEAFLYLSRLPAQWAGTSRRDCNTYSEANIRRLNKDFAVRVAHMARAWQRATGQSLTILSAHRSADEQKCVCDGELGTCKGWKNVQRTEGVGAHRKTITDLLSTGEISNHERGMAIDMRPGRGSLNEYVRFKEFLERHRNEFQLHLPYWSLGDRPHIEPIEIEPMVNGSQKPQVPKIRSFN